MERESSLTWITGIPGVGKSTVLGRLNELGYTTMDADENGMSEFFEKSSGKTVTMMPEVRDAEWDTKHNIRLIRKKVEELAGRAKREPVFLAGATANENEVWDLFDTVILLTADAETIRHRIATRDTNDFGKLPHQLETILQIHAQERPSHYNSPQVHVIDATQPLDAVVDQVVAAAGLRKVKH